MKVLVKLLFFVFGCLPHTLAILLGRTLGWLLCHVIRLRRPAVEAHLAIAFPDMPWRERRAILRRFYRHFALTVIESLRLAHLSAEHLRNLCAVDGQEHLNAALAKGKGVLVLTGHFGCWEIGLAAATEKGYALHTVTKQSRSATGQFALDTMRDAHRVQQIPRRKSIFQILRVLRANEIVGFVLDQNMTASEGIFVDFFGRPACTMPGLAVLAERHGTPVVPAYFYRDPDLRHHHAVILPEVPWETVSQDAQENIRHNTQRYTQVLEGIIRQHPDQWLWLHKRWRTRPPTTDNPVPSTPASPGDTRPPERGS